MLTFYIPLAIIITFPHPHIVSTLDIGMFFYRGRI